MDVQAYFSDIRAVIVRELAAARIDITAAVAWLTDPDLLEPLITAARRGCRVRVALLDDSINRRSGLNLERLQAAGGEVFWIPDADGRAGSLHHKFCVIDQDAVITGSYNWTRRASRADENILLVQGDAALAAGYAEAFTRLLEKHALAPAPVVPDTQQLLRRLEVIRNLLLLDDTETVTAQLPRLAAARELPAVAELLALLTQGAWALALARVQEIVARGMAVVAYRDPAIEALRLELRTLEAHSVALSDEQAELERSILLFARRQHEALGDVLEDCLRLRAAYQRHLAAQSGTAEDRAAYEDARAEHEEYQSAREELDREPAPPTLDPAAQRELKRLYREASMRCHPDRVTEEDKAAAEAVFVQVQAAYQANDLETLRRLHRQLRDGRVFTDPAEVLTEADQLRRRVARLQLDIERRMQTIQALRASETYRTLAGIADWEAYFTQARERLEQECEQLRKQLEAI